MRPMNNFCPIVQLLLDIAWFTNPNHIASKCRTTDATLYLTSDVSNQIHLSKWATIESKNLSRYLKLLTCLNALLWRTTTDKLKIDSILYKVNTNTARDDACTRIEANGIRNSLKGRKWFSMLYSRSFTTLVPSSLNRNFSRSPDLFLNALLWKIFHFSKQNSKGGAMNKCRVAQLPIAANLPLITLLSN